MQPFFIKGFQEINTLVVFAISEQRKYKSVNGLTKHFYEFLCDGNFRISRVLRCDEAVNNAGGFMLPRGDVFTINDVLQSENHPGIKSGIITGFKIENGIMMVSRKSTANDRALVNIPLTEAFKYVAPVVVVAPAPVIVDNDVPVGIIGIQRQILANNPRKLYIGDNAEFNRGSKISRTRREPISEFLVKFFTNWNNSRKTLYVDDNSMQTDINKRRSLGDIFMICRYYYPTCTLKEVAKALYVTLPIEINPGFRSCKCSTIHKRVWYYDENKENTTLQPVEPDEYVLTPQQWFNNLV